MKSRCCRRRIMTAVHFTAEEVRFRTGTVSCWPTARRCTGWSLTVRRSITRQEVTKKDDAVNATIEVLSEQFDLDSAAIRDLIENEKTKNSQYQVLKTEIPQDEKDAYEDYISPDEDTKESLSKEELRKRGLVTGVCVRGAVHP